MTFTLEIEMGNEAMRTPYDVAASLTGVTMALHTGATVGTVKDDNGNTVGRWSIDTDEA
jgi:hypothetical protein